MPWLFLLGQKLSVSSHLVSSQLNSLCVVKTVALKPPRAGLYSPAVNTFLETSRIIAYPAIYRSAWYRLKGNFTQRPATGAYRLIHAPRSPGIGPVIRPPFTLAAGAAFRTTCRFVGKPFSSIKFLLAGRKDKFLAAVAAQQFFISVHIWPSFLSLVFVRKLTGTFRKAMEEITSQAKLFTADQFWTYTYYTIFAAPWLAPFLFFLPVRAQPDRLSQVNVPHLVRIPLRICV